MEEVTGNHTCASTTPQNTHKFKGKKHIHKNRIIGLPKGGRLYKERNEMDYRERRSMDRGPREMHKATCSDCGKECEVPFKPTDGRPVYCNECFAKHRPPRRF